MRKEKFRKRNVVARKRWFSLVIVVGLIFFAFFLYSCRRKASDFNFIFMTLDTQRSDYIGIYNHPVAGDTPNLDSLAKKGIVFENCFCLVPTTLPSHANMFFSESPQKLKVFNNGQVIRNRNKPPSFVQVFKKHEFTSAAFISLKVLKKRFGLSEGFNVYKEDFHKRRWYLTAAEVNDNVLPWLEQNKDNKFFLWVHYSDPHEPYYPPPSEKELKLYLNGNLVREFYLDKTKYSIDLDLKKGVNHIVFEVKNEFIEDPEEAQAVIDKLNISELQKEQNVQVRLTEGWEARKIENRYLIHKQGKMTINNPASTQKIKLFFSAKLITPLENKLDQYRREVEYMDQQIGILLEKLKELNLDRKTNFLIIGDHGEGLGEYMIKTGKSNIHPHFGHTHYLYSVYMKIPLIIYRPQSDTNGVKIKAPVTTLDVAPTIMNIMGFKNLKHFEGKNLLKIKNSSNRQIYHQAHKPLANKNRFALLEYPWHLISTPGEQKYELFNLEDDPYEENDIYSKKQESSLLIRMKKELNSFIREVLEEKKTSSEISEESKDMLRTLGYIK